MLPTGEDPVSRHLGRWLFDPDNVDRGNRDSYCAGSVELNHDTGNTRNRISLTVRFIFPLS